MSLEEMIHRYTILTPPWEIKAAESYFSGSLLEETIHLGPEEPAPTSTTTMEEEGRQLLDMCGGVDALRLDLPDLPEDPLSPPEMSLQTPNYDYIRSSTPEVVAEDTEGNPKQQPKEQATAQVHLAPDPSPGQRLRVLAPPRTEEEDEQPPSTTPSRCEAPTRSTPSSTSPEEGTKASLQHKIKCLEVSMAHLQDQVDLLTQLADRCPSKPFTAKTQTGLLGELEVALRRQNHQRKKRKRTQEENHEDTKRRKVNSPSTKDHIIHKPIEYPKPDNTNTIKSEVHRPERNNQDRKSRTSRTGKNERRRRDRSRRREDNRATEGSRRPWRPEWSRRSEKPRSGRR